MKNVRYGVCDIRQNCLGCQQSDACKQDNNQLHWLDLHLVLPPGKFTFGFFINLMARDGGSGRYKYQYPEFNLCFIHTQHHFHFNKRDNHIRR